MLDEFSVRDIVLCGHFVLDQLSLDEDAQVTPRSGPAPRRRRVRAAVCLHSCRYDGPNCTKRALMHGRYYDFCSWTLSFLRESGACQKKVCGVISFQFNPMNFFSSEQ